MHPILARKPSHQHLPSDRERSNSFAIPSASYPSPSATPSNIGSPALSIYSNSSTATVTPLMNESSSSSSPVVDPSFSRRPSNLQISLPPSAPNGQMSNSLALKTNSQGSTSLFQTAIALRSRLASIPNFAPYLSYRNTDEFKDISAVNQVWRCLRLGSSLVFLINRVGETGVWNRVLGKTSWEPVKGQEMLWPSGEGALNWQKEMFAHQSHKKALQRPLAMALGFLGNLKRAGGWKDDELWNLADMYADDTNALVKIFHTITLLLNLLPQHSSFPPESPSPATSYNPSSGFVGTQPLCDSPGNSSLKGLYNNNGIAGIPGAMTPGGAAMMMGGRVPGQAMGTAANIVIELMETERKYVAELELLQSYAKMVVERQLISKDTAHEIFFNIDKLIDFQRRFQMSLEMEEEKGSGPNWRMGDWGKAFVRHEDEFACYDAYTANYARAVELVLTEVPNLQRPDMDLPLEPTNELPAFLIKPIQRLTKYPLLLSTLVKETNNSDYTHHASLVAGLDAVKRILEKVNETSRESANEKTVLELQKRVGDWKGHVPSHFGKLLVDGTLDALKGGTAREYHVFLFEKMLLCCKKIEPEAKSNKKPKSSSSSKATSASGKSGFTGPLVPMSVKGRIYVNNLTSTENVTLADGSHQIQVWWRSQDEGQAAETLQLVMPTKELLDLWSKTLDTVIKAQRESARSERSRSQQSPYHQTHSHSHSTGSNIYKLTQAMGSFEQTPPPSAYSPSVSVGASSSRRGYDYPEDSDERGVRRQMEGLAFEDDEYGSSYAGTPYEGETDTVAGLPRPRRDSEAAERNGARRSAPPGREPTSALAGSSSEAMRARARTEDGNGGMMQDWRQQELARQARQPMPAMPTRGYSTQSNASDVSFVGGPVPSQHRTLRQQASSSNLRRPSEAAPPPPSSASSSHYPYSHQHQYSTSSQSNPRYASQPPHARPTGGSGPAMAPPIPSSAPQYRNRSASSPNVYQQLPPNHPDLRPPPLPTNGLLNSFSSSSSSNTSSSPVSSIQNTAIPSQLALHNSSKSSLANSLHADSTRKRGSGESSNTSFSIESQPGPITPYTSNNATGLGIRHGSGSGQGTGGSVGPGGTPISRQGSGDSTMGMGNSKNHQQYNSQPNQLVVKVQFDRNQFMIQVEVSSSVEDVKDKVMRKVTSGRADVHPRDLVMLWTDPDDDQVQLKTQEDWEICISDHAGRQIELLVSIRPQR